MKILILSCNTGEGHNSAAAALREEFLRQGACCETADALAFLSPLLSRLLASSHTFAYRRAPKAFSAVYGREEACGDRRLLHWVFRGSEALLREIRQGQYDAVVSVHVFAAAMLTALRRQGEALPPLYFVATDYTCSPGVGELEMDAWFIPHEDLREEFLACGVPEEKLVAAGIPVCRCFRERTERTLARRRLGLPQEGRMVLLCCGSMGCGPMKMLAEGLSEALPPGGFTLVLCGKNEALRRTLAKRRLPRTYVRGYAAEMPLCMDAAELYLTKAGGLSTAEALEKGLPLLYVDAVGGCEGRNRRFLLEKGFALGAEKNEDLPALAAACLARPERPEELLRRIGARPEPRAAERIAARVLTGENGR